MRTIFILLILTVSVQNANLCAVSVFSRYDGYAEIDGQGIVIFFHCFNGENFPVIFAGVQSCDTKIVRDPDESPWISLDYSGYVHVSNSVYPFMSCSNAQKVAVASLPSKLHAREWSLGLILNLKNLFEYIPETCNEIEMIIDLRVEALLCVESCIKKTYVNAPRLRIKINSNGKLLSVEDLYSFDDMLNESINEPAGQP